MPSQAAPLVTGDKKLLDNTMDFTGIDGLTNDCSSRPYTAVTERRAATTLSGYGRLKTHHMNTCLCDHPLQTIIISTNNSQQSLNAYTYSSLSNQTHSPQININIDTNINHGSSHEVCPAPARGLYRAHEAG